VEPGGAQQQTGHLQINRAALHQPIDVCSASPIAHASGKASQSPACALSWGRMQAEL